MAYDDNVDDVKPGDRVTITGIFRAQALRQNQNQRVLKSVYNTYIDVISYTKIKTRQEELEAGEDKSIYSEEVRTKFLRLAAAPGIYDKLVYSLAPSIWEQDDIKKGLLC
jgi:DNA replication licensing factor MCM4